MSAITEALKIIEIALLNAADKTITNARGRVLIEKDIESHLIKRCKSLGWMCEKFSSPQKSAVPDRMITLPDNDLLPFGFIAYMELKAPYKKPTKLQLIDHAIRRDLGCVVFVCDSYEEVDCALAILRYMHIAHDRNTPIPSWLLS